MSSSKLPDARPAVAGVSGRARIGDAALAFEILAVLGAADTPLTGDELRRRVSARHIRTDHAVRLLLAAGRVRALGRSGYVLNDLGGDDAAA